MSDIKQFRLPDVGEGLTEADIVSWHVRPGDRVTVNQAIVEIETAKSLVELPCPFDGVVTELLAEEGQTVAVGTPIIAVDTAPAAGEPQAVDAAPAREEPREAMARASATATRPAGAPAQAGEPTPGDTRAGPPTPDRESQSVLVGYGVKPGATTRRRRKPGHVPAAPPAGAPPRTGVTAPTSPPLAKPPVRKLAKDLGVDLAGLTGSGPGGAITRDDVQRAAAGAPTPGPGAPATGSALTDWASDGRREERIPIRGVRKRTATAMTASAFTAPHVTEFLQVDVTETMDAVRRIRELPEFAGARVSPLLLVAKALLVAVARHPLINSSWDETAGEIVVKHYVNLGIATATDRGLLVPNIKNAHTLSLPALARALTDLVATARDGRASPTDLTGGTITITNVGVFKVDAGTPILTPGEAAILAFGQVRDMPWVHGGQIAVRQVTTLSLSFDHRIVDGDLGSAVLRDVGAMLEDPLRVLAWS